VVPDGGVIDAGPVDGGMDSGVPPSDAGGFACGVTTCTPDQTCLGDMCWTSCVTNEDCGELTLGCLENFGVCICRVPCFNGQQDCPTTYECIDGCCNI
jgi:hypothetical protein